MSITPVRFMVAKIRGGQSRPACGRTVKEKLNCHLKYENDKAILLSPGTDCPKIECYLAFTILLCSAYKSSRSE